MSDSDSDSAPESISFDTSKKENVKQAKLINEQMTQIREAQKKKRLERQERYIEQKKKKLESLKLPDDILDNLDQSDQQSNNSPTVLKGLKKKKIKVSNTRKIFDDETDLTKTTMSDFIPLKTYKDYGISVVNLEQVNKMPLVASDRAKSFKSQMYNRPGVRRQTADERIGLAQKRKLVK